MAGITVWLAAIVVGVDVGWQPHPDGGLEYIIQIEPYMLDSLKTGEDIYSDVPPNVRGVRAYRITVGTAEVPRQMPPRDSAEAGGPPKAPTWPLSETGATQLPDRAGGSLDPFDDRQATNQTGSDQAEGPVQEPDFPAPWSAQAAETETEPTDTGRSQYGAWGPPPGAVSEEADGPSQSDPSPGAHYEPPGSAFDWPASASRESGSTETPSRFPEQQAVHIEQAEKGPSAEPTGRDEGEAEDTEPARPWLPFTVSLAGLFGAVGGMLYFGWIAWDYRLRYRSLLERLIETGRQSDHPGPVENDNDDGGVTETEY